MHECYWCREEESTETVLCESCNIGIGALLGFPTPDFAWEVVTDDGPSD